MCIDKEKKGSQYWPCRGDGSVVQKGNLERAIFWIARDEEILERERERVKELKKSNFATNPQTLKISVQLL